jgi:hypothetical protein
MCPMEVPPRQVLLVEIEYLGNEQLKALGGIASAPPMEMREFGRFLRIAADALNRHFGARPLHQSAFGHALCAWSGSDASSWQNSEPSLTEPHVIPFFRSAALVLADLVDADFLVRCYVAHGSISTGNSHTPRVTDRMSVARRAGTALERTVKLEQQAIRCVGLFVCQNTAQMLGVSTCATVAKGSRLVDLRTYLSPLFFEDFIRCIICRCNPTPTDDKSLIEWLRVTGEEAPQTLHLEMARRFRESRNSMRFLFHNLLENLTSEQP